MTISTKEILSLLCAAVLGAVAGSYLSTHSDDACKCEMRAAKSAPHMNRAKKEGMRPRRGSQKMTQENAVKMSRDTI